MTADFDKGGGDHRLSDTGLDVTPDSLTDDTLKNLRRRIAMAEAKSHVLELENKQLRQERTKAVLLASRAEHVLNENLPTSGEEVQQRIDALMKKLMHAEETLHAARLEHASAIKTVKRSLEKEYSRQLDSIRQDYDAELSAQLRALQQRLADEFSAKLANARQAWNAETEARLFESKAAAARSLTQARSKWQRQKRMIVRRMAWRWRFRERNRLANARRIWQATHRDVLEKCNRQWQAKLVRMRRRCRHGGRWRASRWYDPARISRLVASVRQAGHALFRVPKITRFIRTAGRSKQPK